MAILRKMRFHLNMSERLSYADVELKRIVNVVAPVQRERDVESQRSDRGEISQTETGRPLELAREIGDHLIKNVPPLDKRYDPDCLREPETKFRSHFDNRAPAEGIIILVQRSDLLKLVTADGSSSPGIEALIRWKYFRGLAYN